MKKNNFQNGWALVVSLNVLAIVFFYLLYSVSFYRPYSNMLYFFLMAVTGIFCSKKYSLYIFSTGLKKTFLWSGIGSAAMILGYGLLRVIYFFVIKYRTLAGVVDTEQWGRFVAPWIQINRAVSVMGIVLVVFATEFFYRAYLQAFFESKFKKRRHALLLASALSGLRGIGGGRMAGPFDFVLALVWGEVYIEGGLAAVLTVHMVWDIFFVYFSP